MSDLFKFQFLFLISFIFLVSTPLVSAESYQQNSVVDIKVSCLNINCGTTTEISIELPDTTLVVDNETMTQKDGFVNYTFSQTETFGEYKYYVVSVGGNPEFYEDSFTITADGQDFVEFPTLLIFLIIIPALIILSYFHPRLSLMRRVSSMVAIIFGVIILYPGYNFTNYSTLLGLALGSIYFALGLYYLIEDSFSRNPKEDSSYYERRYDD